MEEHPPGFRFYPTEEELISFYLINQLEGRGQDLHRVIPVVQLYEIEPWHLPKLSGEPCQRDTEQWFFFAPRQEREERGGRPSRTMAAGYWKATGSPSYVYSSGNNRVIGVKKTMVFYKGKAPTGRKTKWKMNEYRAIGVASTSRATVPKLRHEFSLCRVYVTSGAFRSFDRRPLEPAPTEKRPFGDRATTSSPNNTIVDDNVSKTPFQDTVMVQDGVAPISQDNIIGERRCSLETSYSSEDHAYPPETTTNTNWRVDDDVEPPLWDWEEPIWP